MGDAVGETGATTRVGSYEILRELARGGMAELFLARAIGPEGFEKLVVLKKILPTHAANPKFVRLFLDEAKLAATFDHPSIAHVYDMGMVDGNYFFTMEFVHGQDVRATLRRTDRMKRQLPIEHAVQVARNVAAALHYAHERRRPDGTLLDIVHRDVSPSNIVISYDGAVKLLDFGVAKTAKSSVKTRTGALKGKIGYMSPEQAKGASIDRRSDIFSLGIVLHEMISTRRLFKAENDLATLQAIIACHATPLGAVRAECPAELARITARALAREPADRYQTAEDFQLDLEELAREQRLGQSSIALSKHMHGLFGAEIEAWRNAQAQGITLTEHISSIVEMGTPASASEHSHFDDAGGDDDDDAGDEGDGDDEDGGDGGDGGGGARAAPVIAPARASAARIATSPLAAGAVIPRGHTHGDATPIPRPVTVPPPLARLDATPIPRLPLMTPPSLPAVGSTPSGQMPAARVDPTGGFPLAPREWLPPEDPPALAEAQAGDALSARFMKRTAMWVGGVAGALVLLALIFGSSGSGTRSSSGGSGDLPAATASGSGEPSAPAAAAAVSVDAAVAPDAATPRDAAVTEPPDASAPPALDAAVPAAKPPPTGRQPLPGRQMPKFDHPKAKDPPPKRYDPNSALPPP